MNEMIFHLNRDDTDPDSIRRYLVWYRKRCTDMDPEDLADALDQSVESVRDLEESGGPLTLTELQDWIQALGARMEIRVASQPEGSSEP